jgi:hypothetical protein
VRRWPTPCSGWRSTRRKARRSRSQRFGSPRVDAWHWNGTAWAAALAGVRPVRGRFDSGAIGALVLDELDQPLFYSGTFLWRRHFAVATAADAGTACGDPAVATPFVTSFGLPRMGDLDYRLDVRAEAQRAGVLVFATRPALLPFGPGCDWQFDRGPGLLVVTRRGGDGPSPRRAAREPQLPRRRRLRAARDLRTAGAARLYALGPAAAVARQLTIDNDAAAGPPARPRRLAYPARLAWESSTNAVRRAVRRA